VCIIWTSGTTGTPKGAIYTHDAMATIARNVGGPRRAARPPAPRAAVSRTSATWAGATRSRATGSRSCSRRTPWSVDATLDLVDAEQRHVHERRPDAVVAARAAPRARETDFSALRVAGMGAGGGDAGARACDARAARLPVLNGYSQHRGRDHQRHARRRSDDVVAGTSARAPESSCAPSRSTARATPVGEVGEIVCRSPR
jgi:acyl-CoA synthetase (AMP-forming)/AMP-acid ligase II